MKRAAYPSALVLSLTLIACGGNGPDIPLANTASPAAPEAAAPAVAGANPEQVAQQESAAPDAIDESTASTASTAVAAATVLYVGPNGSDSNSGTQSAPLRSILKASQLAQPGTTVYVLPGTYTGGMITTKSGTASARIRYVSTTRYAAKLVAPAGSTSQYAWLNKGNYVDIIGFQIDGRDAPKWRNGILTHASHGVINENYIHHLAQAVPCDSNGGSAINTTYYYKGVNIEIERNVVHDIGAASCKFIQGIYTGTSGTIKNNVVYRVGYAAIHLWHDAHSLKITNNTVLNSGYGILVGGGDFYHRTVADNIEVSNNIVVNNDAGIGEQGTVNSTNNFFNNLAYNNKYYNFSVNGYNAPTGSIVKDPQFMDMAGNDFRLRSTSPAIGTGAWNSMPATDFDGVARPYGARPDMGATEYVGPDAR